jgi:CP12 domain
MRGNPSKSRHNTLAFTTEQNYFQMAALTLRCPVTTVRPVTARATGLRNVSQQQRLRVLVRASPAQTSEKSPVETAIDNAKETCESGSTGECAAAWDEVEELSADVAHKKLNKGSSDPLEQYCDENPEADECRVYED